MTTTRHPLLTETPPVADAVHPARVDVTWPSEGAPTGASEGAPTGALADTSSGTPADLASSAPSGAAPNPSPGTGQQGAGPTAAPGTGPAPRPRSGVQVSRPRRYAPIKRAIDAVVAGAALVVLAPVIGLVWVAVRARLGTPAFFVQERVTAGGRRFRLGKFRTMRPVDRSRGWVTDDDRLTPFGTWLRSSSLDELPSLWNILLGDMSIVGPRPLPTRYLPIYSPAQHRRHAVRAGLTGLAQVSGRNNVPWDERFDLDQRYVLLMGPLLDLTIIARTVRTVLSRDGVAEGDLATSTEFPGPLRTPRLRFVPWAAERGDTEDVRMGGSAVRDRAGDGIDASRPLWEARTPQNVRVATCGWALREETGGGERIAELFITGFDRTAGPTLAADVAALLVNRARAADCTHARIQLSPGDTDLKRAFQDAGLERTGAGSPHRDEDAELLTADIRCLDDPLTAGAGQ